MEKLHLDTVFGLVKKNYYNLYCRFKKNGAGPFFFSSHYVGPIVLKSLDTLLINTAISGASLIPLAAH